MTTRLNKFLVESGVCSRRAADALMEEGRITVNGVRATLGMKVEGDEDIALDGKPIQRTTERVYLAYHKPVGIICTSDDRAQDNIITAIGYPERIFHIGRLDVASSGLILLTNDGNIVNAILRAETHHEKEYIVSVDRPLREASLQRFREGVFLDNDPRRTLPARVTQVNETTFRIILIEGRNRQIRRMCESEGYNVTRLQRERVMHITLEGLPVGHWRHLTKEEEHELLRSTR